MAVLFMAVCSWRILLANGSVHGSGDHQMVCAQQVICSHSVSMAELAGVDVGHLLVAICVYIFVTVVFWSSVSWAFPKPKTNQKHSQRHITTRHSTPTGPAMSLASCLCGMDQLLPARSNFQRRSEPSSTPTGRLPAWWEQLGKEERKTFLTVRRHSWAGEGLPEPDHCRCQTTARPTLL